jgi:hypothetical protein
VGNYGKYLTLTNGATYNLFKDYHEMEKEAKERIEEDLDEEGLFNQDFIDSHQEISDTDARMFGVDAGDMAVEDRDLDELKERAEQEGVDFDDLAETMDEPDEDAYEDKKVYEKAYDAWEKKVEDANEKLEAKLIDDVSSAVADEVEERIKDNGLRSYIVDDEGFCSDEEFQEQYGKWMHLNIEEAVDDALSQDGIGHFISGYDGDYHETSDKQYLVKHND